MIALSFFLCLLSGEIIPDPPTSTYEKLKVENFVVRLHPDARQHPKETNAALKALKAKLKELEKLFSKKQFEVIGKVPVWLEWDNPKREQGDCCYHPSADWLRAHRFNVDKQGGVEIRSVQSFLKVLDAQPMVLLHEMAHAYHFLVLGDDHQAIRQAFAKVKAGNLYQRVPHVDGDVRRSYALTNDKEYFAESSEAYFGVNDFFPFNNEDLAAYDPATYLLLRDVWGPRKGRPRKPPIVAPNEAAGRLRERVTVEFIVQSVGENPGGFDELYSAKNWTEPGSFFIRFDRRADLGAVNKYLHRRIRVTGSVLTLTFDGAPHGVIYATAKSDVALQD